MTRQESISAPGRPGLSLDSPLRLRVTSGLPIRFGAVVIKEQRI